MGKLAATEGVAAWTAEGGCHHISSGSDPPPRQRSSRPERVRGPVPTQASRPHVSIVITYTDCSLENDWTHIGAVYGLGAGADEGTWDLGAVCDCVCRQRAIGHAGGFCGRDVCVSGSAEASDLHHDGIAGIGAGKHSAVYLGVSGRREGATQADFGGALSEDSSLV